MTLTDPLADLPLFEGDPTPPVERTGTISLAGRTYLMDPTKGFMRQTLDMRRASQDQGSTPGQQTLTDAGLWHRSQIDWTLGAGQRHFDRPDSSDRRYWTSKGVDPWTAGELRLLNDTTRVFTTTSGDLHCLGVGGYVFFGVGNTLYASSNGFGSYSTATQDDNIKGVTTDGAYVYTISDSGVRRSLVGSGTIALFSTFGGDAIAYANGRLIAADGPRIVEIDSTGTAGGDGVLDYTHPNASFQWVNVCSAPNAIYATGRAGDRSLIYAIGVDTNTGGLRVPTFAAAVPDGEVVNVICEYGGLIILGTSRGVRCAQITGNSALSIGPVIEVGGGVACFEPQGEYVWFGWTNYDSQSTGLGRLALAELTAPLVPAYASDLMAATQGRVTGVATFGALRVFCVEGSGLWLEHANTPVASGQLDGGEITWNTFALKTAAAFDVRHAPLAGTITASTHDERDVIRTAGTSDAPTSLGPTAPFSMADVHGEAIHPVVTLTAAGTTSPVLRRWTISGVVRPQRQDRYVLPLMFHAAGTNWYGVPAGFDPVGELAFLKALEATGQVIPQIVGTEKRRVQIDRITQGGDNVADWTDTLDGFEGIVLVETVTQDPGI